MAGRIQAGMQMIDKVRRYAEQYNMLKPNDTVVAGVSGGADSLCLLFLLKEFAKEIPLTIAVVHVNHGIRKDAEQDAAYVKEICAKLEIPFFLKEVNIEEVAKKAGISTEEAGRNVRYEAFSEALQQLSKTGEGKIAVAHTANDRAETMLFHLFRGTGLTGLSGIKPVRGQIIRPLLCLERAEIEQYLEEKETAFCIDSTNNEDTYTRNKIRHHILPFAEENICEKTVSHMNRTAEMLLETEEFLKEQTLDAYRRAAEETGEGIFLSVKTFLEQPALLQKRILLYCMETVTAGRKDIGAVHIEDMAALFYKNGNKEQTLPYGLTARREFDRVFIGKTMPQEEIWLREEPVLIPGEVKIESMGVFEFRIFEYDKSKIIPEKTYTKWFDYDKIEKSLVLRTRQTGDYLTINEALSRKSLKKYFIQEKIPKKERERIYVLAEENHILWVPGYRISQHYKVNSKTKTILQVHFRGGHC